MYVIVHQYSICNHGMFIWERSEKDRSNRRRQKHPTAVSITHDWVKDPVIYGILGGFNLFCQPIF